MKAGTLSTLSKGKKKIDSDADADNSSTLIKRKKTIVQRKLSQKQALSCVQPSVTYPLDTSKSRSTMHMEGVMSATVYNWTGFFNNKSYSFDRKPKFDEPEYTIHIKDDDFSL
ncbi:7574_t:CDS:2 [Funneliformis caledonium]|uniref:7574_t:CDS:1 n=1 Tax=Funneliformis caledonium TaxID=1117310 RepID=A0A9N9EYI2_9GLOM|nr:7574_t:CDS:2 [Funneliformis caledonium]